MSVSSNQHIQTDEKSAITNQILDALAAKNAHGAFTILNDLSLHSVENVYGAHESDLLFLIETGDVVIDNTPFETLANCQYAADIMGLQSHLRKPLTINRDETILSQTDRLLDAYIAINSFESLNKAQDLLSASYVAHAFHNKGDAFFAKGNAVIAAYQDLGTDEAVAEAATTRAWQYKVIESNYRLNLFDMISLTDDPVIDPPGQFDDFKAKMHSQTYANEQQAKRSIGLDWI